MWTEEPNAGGGTLEDVYGAIYVGQLVAVPRFLVAGGAGIQHDPVVAASASGFVVALADNSVAGGQLILKFYNAVGGLITTVPGADGPEGVNTPGGAEDDYRDVSITVLANGNYVVTWADNAPTFDIWARIYSPTGVAQTGLIEIEAGGSVATFPDVTALADGRFLVTYEQYNIKTVRGHIYEANGTASTDPFTITTNAANALNQQVQSAALNDGRFVTVWRTITGNIEGQVMFADGTPDGAAFAINGDGAGDKGRPTVATLADGRFAVSWESGAGATATIFTTIFDPREAGLNTSASGLNDDWQGSGFTDVVHLGAGSDRMAGGGGGDTLFGDAGQDTLSGDASNDTLYGGNDNDALNGGDGADTLHGELGADTLTGGTGPDTLLGGNGNDTLVGDNGNDVMVGGAGNDVITGGGNNDTVSYETSLAGISLALDGSFAAAGDAASDTLLTIESIIGTNFVDTLAASSGTNWLTGLGGNDIMDGRGGNDLLIGGLGADTLTGGAGRDVFDYDAILESGTAATANDTITDFNENAQDKIDLATIDSIAGGANDAFSFIGSAVFTALGQVRAFQSGGNTFIDMNTQGSLALDMRIKLTGAHVLDAADFVL